MRSSAVAAGQIGTPLQYNNLFKDAQAAGYLLPHQQKGVLAMPNNPANNTTVTLTVNGTGIVATFVNVVGTTANQIAIGNTIAQTLINFMAWLQNPEISNPTQVAATLANQNLLSYLSFALNSTSITISFPNSTINSPLSSISISTTVSGASWTADTMALYVEPGVYCLGNAVPIVFAGGNSPDFTAPSSHPRIDLLTVDSSGTLAITQGTEAVSPSAPSYPYNKIVLCEVYNVVGETSILDNDNQSGSQGYIKKDARNLITDVYFTNASQFANGVIPDAALASSFLHAGGSVNETESGILTFSSPPSMPGNPSGANDMCNQTYALSLL